MGAGTKDVFWRSAETSRGNCELSSIDKYCMLWCVCYR